MAAFALSAATSFGALTPPKVIKTVSPQHPAELFARGVDGSATILLRIDETGKVSETKVIEASDPAFGEAAAEAAKQWTFTPARRDGAPAAVSVRQTFNFSVPVEKKLEVLAGRPVIVEVTGRTVQEIELQQPLTLRSMPHAIYPSSLAGSGQRGIVKLSFTINAEGLAVNPDIVSSNDSLFTASALAALLHAQWEPPLQDGEPVNVQAETTVFIEETADAQAAPAAAPAAEKKS